MAILGTSGVATSASDVATAPLPADSARTLVVLRAAAPLGWEDAQTLIDEVDDANGAWYLPTDAAGRSLVASLATQLGPWECVGPWLGATRSGGTRSIEDGWLDTQGAAVAEVAWSEDSPAGATSLRWAVAIDGRDESLETWINLLPAAEAGPGSFGLVATVSSDAPDCDGDGVPDAIEERWLGTDPCDGTVACPADLSGDDAVDGTDLGLWLSLAGRICDPGEPCPGDLDGDGEVNGGDLGRLLAAWGDCTGSG